MILNRAKSIYSDEYFISKDIKFELGLMYLRVNEKWRECEKDTRSINFPDMIDAKGNKIFASLSPDGKGGDITETKDGWKVYKRLHLFLPDGTRAGKDLDITEILSKKFNSALDIKVIGIQE